MTSDISLAPLLEHFFTRRLMHQRQASPHTIRSYRDTFRQFLIFAQQRLHQPPSRLTFEQIDAPLIVAFLEDLEKYRGVTVRSRNLRLTAIIRSFVTWRSSCQAIRLRFKECWQYRVSASPANRSASSAVRKSMFCSRHRTKKPGWGAETMPLYSRRCKPVCDNRK